MNQQNWGQGIVIKSKESGDFYVIDGKRYKHGRHIRRIKDGFKAVLFNKSKNRFILTDIDEATAKLIMAL